MWQKIRFRSLAGASAVATLVALSSGCYAEAGAEPAYVDATAAPVDFEAAPHAYYEGRTVYYVNDHWYAQDRGRWRYYRIEPQPLIRQRAQVEHAPRAPDHAEHAPRPPEHAEHAPRPPDHAEHAPRPDHAEHGPHGPDHGDQQKFVDRSRHEAPDAVRVQ